MRIDISRDGYDSSKQFSRLLLQQGRPVLDRDWNEHTDIVLNQVRMLTRSIYGPHGGPTGTACGFLPYVTDKGDLFLRKGDYSVDGVVVHCEGVKFDQQENVGKNHLSTGQYLLILEVTEGVETSASDEDLLEPALPGVDLTARGRFWWRVIARQWDLQAGASPKRAAEEAGKLCSDHGIACGILAPDVTKCAEGHLNELLRAEYHGKVDLGGGTEAELWKLSFSNGSPLFQLSDSSHPTSKHIRLGAMAAEFKPKRGQYAEFLKQSELRMGDAGDLAEIWQVDENDIAGSAVLHLRTKLPKDGHQFVRIWDTVDRQPIVEGRRPGDFAHYVLRGEGRIRPQRIRRPERMFAPLAVFNADEKTITWRFQRVAALASRAVMDRFEFPEFELKGDKLDQNSEVT